MASLIKRKWKNGSCWYIQYYAGTRQRRVRASDNYQIAKEKLRRLETARVAGDELPLVRSAKSVVAPRLCGSASPRRQPTGIRGAGLRLAVPSNHALARLPRVPLEAITDEPLVCLSDAVGGVTESYVKGLTELTAIDIKAHRRVYGIQSLLALVAAGKGVALLPNVARHVHCDDVQYKRFVT